ncbi:MAG: hypothetical protein WCQ20_14965 [Synechococcaceae cyanobacterium ELA739]
MTTTTSSRTIYNALHGVGSLIVKASPSNYVQERSCWLVTFTRYGVRGKQLDQCAIWLSRAQAWDQTRWDPSNSRLVPAEALAKVEEWLREQGDA